MYRFSLYVIAIAGAREIVESYAEAFGRKDFGRMREMLHDTNFAFKGPLHAFHSSDDFAAFLNGLGPFIERIEVKKVIADENDACLLYDLVTNVPAVGTTRMAEWLRVEGGK